MAIYYCFRFHGNALFKLVSGYTIETASVLAGGEWKRSIPERLFSLLSPIGFCLCWQTRTFLTFNDHPVEQIKAPYATSYKNLNTLSET